MLAKKRRASRRSVESLLSEQSAQSLPQHEKNAAEVVDALVEEANGASTLSSTGTQVSRSTAPDSPWVGNGIDSNHANAMMIQPIDNGWGVGLDPHVAPGSSSLPPPAPDGASTASGFDTSAWELFTSDTDWQLSLDSPFTAEHNKVSPVTISTPLTDLDTSSLHGRPRTRNYGSLGSSGEAMESLTISDIIGLTPFPVRSCGSSTSDTIKQNMTRRFLGNMPPLGSSGFVINMFCHKIQSPVSITL